LTERKHIDRRNLEAYIEQKKRKAEKFDNFDLGKGGEGVSLNAQGAVDQDNE